MTAAAARPFSALFRQFMCSCCSYMLGFGSYHSCTTTSETVCACARSMVKDGVRWDSVVMNGISNTMHCQCY